MNGDVVPAAANTPAEQPLGETMLNFAGRPSRLQTDILAGLKVFFALFAVISTMTGAAGLISTFETRRKSDNQRGRGGAHRCQNGWWWPTAMTSPKALVP